MTGAVLLAVVLVLGACRGDVEGAAPQAPPPAQPEAQPWADRPVVDLRFDVADDLRTVAGTERVLFTPDLPVCELVFRAWPNKPATALAGSGLVVTEVRVDGAVTPARDVPAGAPEAAPAGTLLEVPLAECVPAGQEIPVELDFTVLLGEDVDERVGTSSSEEVAWFATAFPLLAWVRDRGWDRDPAVPVTGEMAVSEDFELDSLEVVVPSGYEVMGTGTRAGPPEDTGDGTTIHRFTAPAVRDVAVSVGELDIDVREIDGVRVHMAADHAVGRSYHSDWFDQIEESMGSLSELLGPFPYPELWVTVLSDQTSGIEFPGAVQFGDVDPQERSSLVTHELAHMWFYGRVGNDQGTDPWLDESFATFAQLAVDEVDAEYDDLPRRVRDRVGEPMTFFTEYRRPSRAYVAAVYTAGGAALLEARRQAGEDEFDDALRGYLAENAYTVATPDDLEEAFADLPEALAVLRDAGALP